MKEYLDFLLELIPSKGKTLLFSLPLLFIEINNIFHF